MSTLDTVNEALEELNRQLEKVSTDAAKRRPNPPSVRIAKGITMTTCAVLWGMGVVVAKGFLWTTAALLIPFVGPGTAVYWIVGRVTS